MPRKNNRQTSTKLPRVNSGPYRKRELARKLIRDGNYQTSGNLSGFSMSN